MATAEEINILITSDPTKANAGFKQTEQGIAGLEQTAAKTTAKSESNMKSFTDNVKKKWLEIAAAGTAAYAAINKAAESLKVAAEFEEQTEAIQRQFGVSSDQIIDKLGKASKGMMSNTKLVTIASRAMSLGVTTDLDKMAEMMKYADERGKVLGKSTEEVFSMMVEGIGKQNPRMLKELGLTADAFKVTEDGAESAMTKTEMLGVVMGVVTGTTKNLGDQTLSTADKMAALQASADNAKLALGQSLMPVGEALIPIFKGIVSAFVALPGPLKVVGVALAALIPIVYALYAAMGPLGIAIGLVSAAAVGLVGSIGSTIEKQKAWKKSNEEMVISNNSVKRSMDERNAASNEYANIALEEKKNVAELTEENKKLNAEMALNREAMTKNAAKAAELEVAQKNGTKLTNEQIYDLNRWRKAIREMSAENNRFQSIIDGNASAIDTLNKRTSEAGAVSERLRKFREEQAAAAIKNRDDYLDYIGDSYEKEIIYEEEKFKVLLELNKDNLYKTELIRAAHEKRVNEIAQKYYDEQAAAQESLYQKSISAVKKFGDFALGQVQSVISTMREIRLAGIDTTNQYAEDLSELEAERGVQEQARNEQDMAANIARLQTEKAAAVQAGDEVLAASINRDLQRLAQDQAYNAEKLKLTKQANEREAAIKREQWQAQHDADVAAAWVGVAQAVLSGLAVQPLIPLGLIASGIGGTLATAQAISISNQTMPKFAAGTSYAAGGLAIVGERGPEIREIPMGSVVHPAGVSAPYIPALRESLRGITNNSSTVATTNAQKTFNFTIKADDPVGMLNKIRRQYGDGIFK